MSLIKTEYRIERWKDVYSGGIWSEQKVLVLGADDMTAECRAYNPILDINITGEMTLSFEMVSKYFDSSTGNYVDNYMLPWVFNESKIKLYCPQYKNDVNNGWFDFIVKERTDKRGKNLSYEFKCEYLPLNELRRTGQDLIFNSELSNNIGTLEELATKVLDETGWGLDTINIDITEYVEEQLFSYPLKTEDDFTLTKITTSNVPGGETTVISYAANPSNPILYIPFSEIGSTAETIQVIYIPISANYPPLEPGQNLLIDYGCQYTISRNDFNPPIIDLTISYRGHKIPSNLYETYYDALKERYVTKYEKSEDSAEYYGYKTTEINKTAVEFIGDGIDVSLQIEIASATSWVVAPNHGLTDDDIIRFEYVSFVNGTPVRSIDNITFTNYRVIASTSNKFQISGEAGGAALDFTKAGIGRIRKVKVVDDTTTTYVDKTIFLTDHGLENNDIISFYALEGVTSADEKIQTSVDYSKRYFVIKIDDNNFQIAETEGGTAVDIQGNGIGYIEYMRQDDHNIVLNGETDTGTLTSHGFNNGDRVKLLGLNNVEDLVANKDYYLVNRTDDTFQFSLEEGGAAIDFTTTGTPAAKLLNISKIDPSLDATLVEVDYFYYYDNGIETEYTAGDLTPKLLAKNEKIRTLEAEDENVFNLLQKIAELFKVWIRFDVYHSTNGLITDRKIKFVDRVGEDRQIGFTYGININGIERSIVSNEIASKMRVKQIVNDALSKGYCSIADSSHNPSKEEYLINLDYYVSIGLIDKNDLAKDLYDDGSGVGIAFLTELKRINLLIDYYAIDYEDAATKLTIATERLAAAEDAVKSAQTAIDQLLRVYNNGNSSEAARADYANNYQRLLDLKTKNENYTTTYTGQKETLTARKDSLNEIIEGYKTEKKALEVTFNTKYRKFLQEGSWSGDNYIDADAYYFDAINVLNESSRPMVEYKIDIVDLSVLEGYDYYNFQVGDLTYVEDAEFFGVQSGDLDAREQIYREPVIIAQITANLDNPKNNKIIVRNYNDQFDELFERITATVQSYEFNENKYNRTTERFTTEGAISFPALQKSLISNELILSQSVTEAFKQDNTGVYLTNLQNPLEKVRIVSGGIFLSNDGGTKWSTGITGAGINADWIVAGSIDTSKITIYDGSTPKFVWDSNGITAYSTLEGETLNNYVRLNQNGLIAKKDGETTFEIKASGDATFSGDVRVKNNTLQTIIAPGAFNIQKSIDSGDTWTDMLYYDSSTNTLNFTGNITMTGGSISWNQLSDKPTIPSEYTDAQAKSAALVAIDETYIDGSSIWTIDIYAENITGNTITGIDIAGSKFYNLAKNYSLELGNVSSYEAFVFKNYLSPVFYIYDGDFNYIGISGKNNSGILIHDGDTSTVYPQGHWNFSTYATVTGLTARFS